MSVRKRANQKTYTFQFRWKGKQYVRQTGLTDKGEAEKIERKFRLALIAGRTEVLDEYRLRRPVGTATVGDLETAYRAMRPQLEIQLTTSNLNVHALYNMLRCVRGTDIELKNVNLDEVNGDLVWKFKRQVVEDAADKPPLDQQRLYRSATSLLRQARSLFTQEARSIYLRQHGLQLPKGIGDFMTEHLFRDVGKTDYWPPGDILLAATFASLERINPACTDPEKIEVSDRNIYLAVWLALGFGLRKEEIANARHSWFLTRDGVIYLRGDVLAKNRMLPDIRVQLGAWSKLAPYVTAASTDYLLAGTDTERHELVFRRVSEWMRHLGWKTQKTIHEFRAYAGSKIAQAHGLLAAQAFLRHQSYVTTERFYMRYLKMSQAEVPLFPPADSAATGTAG